MKKILVVEDEKSLVDALEKKLKLENFTVVKAFNGEEGLMAAKLESPDIILLDILMPVMDGMTMLDKLRKEDWGKKIPVLMLTNLYDVDKVAQAMSKGVFDYLVKSDWSMDDLVGMIKEKLDIK